MRICALLLWLLLGILIRAAALQIDSGSYSSGKAYVTCLFDGVKAKCLLDTGSAMTLLTDSKPFSSYTNLGPFYFKSATDIAQQTETIRIAAIQIDDVSFENVKIGRANFPGAEKTLGIDLLGRQPLALKSRSKEILELNAARPTFPLTNLDVASQGMLSIPIDLAGNQTLALWDTGVALTSVDATVVEVHPEIFRPTKYYVNGIDGAGKTLLLQIFRAKKITIADHAFENVRVVSADLSVLRQGVNKQIQAVIGFNLIRKANWFFDPQNRLWKSER